MPSLAGSESSLVNIRAGWSGDESLSFAFPLLQDQPDAMQVGRQHRQGNRTREAVRTMGAHSRFPGHALTPTGVMAIRCKQFHLPDL